LDFELINALAMVECTGSSLQVVSEHKVGKAWLKVVVETIAGDGKILCKIFMTVQEHFTAD
jgi:hypothetical protein